jgi:hypothetical protein
MVVLMMVIYIMEMIVLFYDVQIEHVDRYSLHLMVLDMKYHEKMIDQYFDYNVDNQQELAMDCNNDD